MCSVLSLPKYASVLVLTSIFQWYIDSPVNNPPLMCFVHIYIYCTFIIFRIDLPLAVLIAKKQTQFTVSKQLCNDVNAGYFLHATFINASYVGSISGCTQWRHPHGGKL